MLGPIGNIALLVAKHIFEVFKIGATAIVTRVLAAFGLSLVTFKSILPSLKAFLLNYVQLLPPKVLAFLGAIGFDVAMTMILSALVVRMAHRVFVVPTAVANQLPGGTS